MRATAIVLGAGDGERLGAPVPKAFVELEGTTILELAVRAAAASSAIERIVVAVPAGSEDRARSLLVDIPLPSVVVPGGATRQGSVRAALQAVPSDVAIVAVHDAARCFAPADLFDRVVRAVAGGADGAVPVAPVPDTVKRVERGRVVGTIDRATIGLAQTPQAFRLEMLKRAHERAAAAGEVVTDDAMLLEDSAVIVAVEGDPGNAKITTDADLAWAISRLQATRG